jgi:hypothetical protein
MVEGLADRQRRALLEALRVCVRALSADSR